MIIHIVRHAEAIERSPEIPEEQRYLTARGRKRFRKICKCFRNEGGTPDLILTSPLIRAVQTADMLAEKLRYDGELLVESLLAPGFGPEKLDELLGRYPRAKEIALVGHEPDLGSVAQALLESEAGCALDKGGILSFKMAGVQGKAEFLRLLSGDAKMIDSRGKALRRMQGEETAK